VITAIAIDDEPAALGVIRVHASKVPFLEMKGYFTNPLEAMSYLSGNKVDLLFVDIRMPDLSGTEFIRAVGSRYAVVLTTAHSEYALDGFELDAVDYLLKPFELQRFTKALQKVQERITPSESGKYIFVNTGFQLQRIDIADILYLEGDGNYVAYQLPESRILVRAVLRDCLSSLRARGFIQVHRSFIVAVDKIERVLDNHVHVGSLRIPIGASYRSAVLDKLRCP
jgi:two-component system, LytTR family, response regulator